MTIRDIDRDYIPPPRLFDAQQLAQILEIQPKVDCECPNHLASLVSSLVAFEAYSRVCEDKNEADARIHSLLYRETAEARGRLERALVRLCEFEGISLTRDEGVEARGATP